MPKNRVKNTRVFKAKTRILFDLLLVTNSVFFVLFAMQIMPFENLKVDAIAVNVAFIFLWYGVASPLTKIRIDQGIIYGRSASFRKVSFPLRRVHHVKTMAPITPFLKWFYKDIWSIDGQRIRLHRRIIGQDQVRKIMVVIQDYPFKENPPDKAKELVIPPPQPSRYQPEKTDSEPGSASDPLPS